MTAIQPTDTQVPVRSTFVTVVAWIFIVLSGFGTLMTAMQNFMFRSMPFDQFDTAFQDSTAVHLPAAARFMFSHWRLFFLAAFLVALLVLVSSIGLLRRRNWARLLFMGILVCWILYMIAGIFIQQSFMSTMNTSFRTAAPQDSLFRANADQFQSMFTMIRVFSIVFSLAIAGVCGWIVARLSSARVRAEFANTAA
jgi:hypothetical protein